MLSSITGASVGYGGGGGGGGSTTGGAAAVGYGGANGRSGTGSGTTAVANLGGGGGGARFSGAGGSGGSGVVILRYRTSPVGMCGTLTGPASCTILTGAGNCSATLSWSITNPEAAPTSITSVGMSNINVSNVLTTPQSGTQAVTVPYNSLGVVYNLYNNSKLLAQASVTPVCTAGTSWDPPSQTCKVPVPVITVTVTPPNSTIYTGGSATIAWTSTNAASCTGTNLNTGNATSGSVVVSPLSTTQYTITCNGVSSNTTIIVKKKPSFIEN